MRTIGITTCEPASDYVSTSVRHPYISRTFVTIPSDLLRHCLAVHVIVSVHTILELVNSVSNSFEYDKFILGIFIIYFSKVLGTYP